MYIYYLLFIIIIILFFNKINNNNIEKFNENVMTQKKFDKSIMDKPIGTLYKVGLKDIKIQRENCFQKCNAQDCTKLYMRRLNYKKCNLCQKNKNKCFNRLNTVGSCDICSDNLKKFNCNHKNDIGCTDPNNIYGLDGIEPYYIEVNSNESNSPFNKKCVFCWELNSFL